MYALAPLLRARGAQQMVRRWKSERVKLKSTNQLIIIQKGVWCQRGKLSASINSMKTNLLASLLGPIGVTAHTFHVHDASCGITYRGVERNGLQHFYGILYGQDTSGENRFKPPRLYVPAPGSVIDATKPGVACPQPLGKSSPPLGQGDVTEVSEDCLNLNVVRPKLNTAHEYGKLPVMVWIHGGRL